MASEMIRRRKPKNKIEKWDAVLCADMHLRDSVPKARVAEGNYLEDQMAKFEFIISLAARYKANIFNGGDMTNSPSLSFKLITDILEAIDGDGLYLLRPLIITAAGQHDLINHRISSLPNTTLGFLNFLTTVRLEQEKQLTEGSEAVLVKTFPYGKRIKRVTDQSYKDWIKVAIAHQFVTPTTKKDWPGQQASLALGLLKKFPEYQLIVTGDNHKPFVAEYEGRLLVNPGSMMRMSADQKNHKPRVYLWRAKDNKLKKVYLPIREDVVDTSHIHQQKKKDDRREKIQAYIETVKKRHKFGVSFKKNLKIALSKKKINKNVQDVIWEAFEK